MSVTLPPGCTLRRATAQDNAAILEFQAAHAMRAGLTLRFDRSPQFFNLLRCHAPQFEVWLLLVGETIGGMATLVIREGYIDGVAQPVAYIGDLRVAPRRRLMGLWGPLAVEQLHRLRAAHGVRFAYGCIIRGNRLARQSLLRAGAGQRPVLTPLRGYCNVSLLARKPWVSRRSVPGVAIRRAMPADREPLRAFLDAQSREQPFGVVFDHATFERRMSGWPDFGVESFWLAVEHASGRLLGCLAPWDARAIRRLIVERPGAALDALRLAFNGLAPLLGKPRIPVGRQDKSGLADVALTHVSIAGRRADVFGALLDAAYRELWRSRRYATVTLCMFDDDPLTPALAPYWSVRVPMDVHVITAAPDPATPTSVGAGVPGFEIYLV